MLDFQKGDPAAFETLMKRYYKRILNFIFRFLGDEQTADDLTQEVFIRVYRSGSSYQPRAKVQTWLFEIAKNLSLNESRRRKRKIISLEEPFEVDDNEVKRQIADHNIPSPDQDILFQENQAAIEVAINSLPENQRAVVLLRRYEDFSYEEIAKTMNCSVSAVKSLLSRARERLKVLLADIRHQ